MTLGTTSGTNWLVIMTLEKTSPRLSYVSFDVKEFGAVGNGEAKDTVAIQRAIDACSASGGGTVTLPAGRYLSGTIFLKSNIELHLQAGATLLGSPDREDYNPDDIFPENVAFVRDMATGAHLIVAYRQTNVSITGHGIIDGNSPAFFGPLPDDAIARYDFKSGNYPIKDWRPGQMICFCLCQQLSVTDVSLVDSPYWGLFVLGCSDVQIRSLTITNPPATRNGDGIDIDCSRNVTISDCIIRSGDDCITVRGNARVLGDAAQPCEDVTVTNCVLSSPCNAIRVGVGNGEIRRCTFSNIVVTNTRTAINIISRYSQSQYNGALIEQVHFSNFVIDARLPMVISNGPDATPPAAIRDISFSHFRITASAGSQFTGSGQIPLQRLRLSDFDFLIQGGTENCSFHAEIPSLLSIHGYHGTNGAAALPCAIYGADLERPVFENIRVRWDNYSAVWRDGFIVERSTDVDFNNVSLRPPHHDGGAVVRCNEVGGVTLRGCQAETGTRTFLQAESSAPGSLIRCTGNDLSNAATPFDTDIPALEAGNLHSATASA
jgi:hypothetical protein